MTIYADRTKSRFFLIPKADDAALPEGSFELQSLSGTTRQVDEAALSHFEISAEAAQRHVKEKVSAVRAVQEEVQQAAAELLQNLERAAAPDSRLSKLLGALGLTLRELQLDTVGTLAQLRDRLMTMSLAELQALPGRDRG
jgi:hypothetical protein